MKIVARPVNDGGKSMEMAESDVVRANRYGAGSDRETKSGRDRLPVGVHVGESECSVWQTDENRLGHVRDGVIEH